MTVGDVVREVVAGLEPADRWAVRGLWLVVKPRPDREDLARGCLPDQRAAYFGRAVDPRLAPLEPADGEVTLFLENLAPLTEARIRVALLHELAHALGWDEATVEAMGLTLVEGEARSCCGC